MSARQAAFTASSRLVGRAMAAVFVAMPASFLPAGLIVAVLSLRTAGLLGRLGAEGLVAVAFIALVGGYALFLRAGVAPDYPAVMLPTVMLLGVAFGFGFSALTVSATSGVRDHQQGLAASLFQTSFQVGGAMVLAVVTAVVEAGGANTLTSPAAVLSAYRPALYLITGAAALGLAAALPGLRRRAAEPAPEEADYPGAAEARESAEPKVAEPNAV